MDNTEKKELTLVISEILEATIIPALDGVRDELKKDIDGVKTDLSHQISQVDRKLIKAIDQHDEKFANHEERIAALEG